MTQTCHECGVCCELFLVNLTEKEYRSGKYQTELEKFGFFEDFNDAKKCGANILKQKFGRCVYLKHGRCSIHSKRPESCRRFFCSSKRREFGSMVDEIRDAKKRITSSTK